MTTLVATAVGAALVAAGLWLVRGRRAVGVHGNPIRVVTSRYLGAKRFLTIVEVDGERLLLGLAGDHVSLVTRLPGTTSVGDGA